MFLLITGNHYKWDWPKSQFCMLNILATIDWLRNLKVANIYFFNILQNTLKIFSFSKLEIRKLENLIFPSSAEPCRILHLFRRILQNISVKNFVILRISAEFRRIIYVPKNCSAEQQNPITFRRSLQKSAELDKSVPQNSAGDFYSAEFFCGTLHC